MTAELSDAMWEEAGPIADHLFRALQGPDTPHYHRASAALLRMRSQALVAAFAQSCQGDPEPFGNYVRTITEERISEGYHLQEMQRALVVLEATAWQVALARSKVGNIVRNLSIVTGTIGRAKDELAIAFLADAARPRVSLQRLFAGTEGHVEPDLEVEASSSGAYRAGCCSVQR